VKADKDYESELLNYYGEVIKPVKNEAENRRISKPAETR
jgi:hypothetical protein